MSDTFETFQKFNDPGLAAVIADKLKAQQIACRLEDEGPNFDITFANNDFEPTTHLKVQTADFPRAHAALEAYYQAQLQDMDPDYYLFSFTDKELLEIIAKPDEWGHLDYALAKSILAERGLPLTPETTAELKEQRLKELSRPEPPHPYQVVFGYLLALAGFFVAGAGILGLILGSILARLKKTLPNGERAFVYPPAERKQGRRILIISAVSFSVWLILLLRRL